MSEDVKYESQVVDNNCVSLQSVIKLKSSEKIMKIKLINEDFHYAGIRNYLRVS